jgi:hypothetical protein
MFAGRPKILQLIKEGYRCAEIGVWRGEFSQEILKRGPSELHLIDPWRHRKNYPRRVYGIAPQKKIDRIYSLVQRKFKDRSEVHIHRQFSAQAVQMFEDNYFDWVYLDGDHSFRQIRRDLDLWFPKTRWLCGDDYSRANWPSVVRAVRRFTRKKNRHLRICGAQFVITRTRKLLL